MFQYERATDERRYESRAPSSNSCASHDSLGRVLETLLEEDENVLIDIENTPSAGITAGGAADKDGHSEAVGGLINTAGGDIDKSYVADKDGHVYDNVEDTSVYVDALSSPYKSI